MFDFKPKSLIIFKIIAILFFTFCVNENTFAQKPKKNSIEVSYGDEYFKNGDYFQAEQYYETAFKKQPNSSYVNYKIAECNRLLFGYAKAEDFYSKTINNTTGGATDYPLAKYYYALMQKMNAKYEQAEASFDQFITEFKPQTPEDESFLAQAKIEKEGCEFAILENKRPLRNYRFEVLPTPVNTKNSDYSPAVFKHDSSIVITSARENNVGGKLYDGTGEAFSDNLRFEKKGEGAWTKMANTDGFDELVNTAYNDGAGEFTFDKQKFYYTQCDDDQGACAIYVTKLLNEKWTNPLKLNANINDPGGWNAQPSISKSGDTLYFSSKRAGGLGLNDIWYSIASQGEDAWGEAVNMGAVINTPFVDMSPNYDSDDKTLFFASSGHVGFGGLDIFMAQGDSLNKIKNMGLPFNSQKDDFYFILGDKKGFLTSNRDGGVGSDDIYMFDIQSKTSLIALVNPDTISKFAESVSVKGKILDQETMEGVPDLENTLTDEKGNVLKKSKTNKEGGFRYDNLDKDQNYMVLLDEKNPKLTNKTNYIVSDLQVRGTKGKPSKSLFENIYFDYDKADIRSEAAKVLDDLIEYCKLYPHLQVELKANTDNLGANIYNTHLSEHRGEAVINYMTNKGVDRSTLVIAANGEEKPAAANDSEMGRQLNRRIEFFILGDQNFQPRGKVYILQPKNTLYSIAKENGMTVEELKNFNGLESNDIKAYSPIRVPRRGNAIVIETTSGATTSEIVNEPTLATGEEYYTIQAGNTMYSIAKQFGMTVDELKSLNGFGGNGLVLGAKIKVKKK